MRILFVIPEISGGGIGTFYRQQLNEFVKHGHMVHVLLTGSKTDEEFINNNKHLNFIDYPKHLSQLNIRMFPLISESVNKYYELRSFADRFNDYDIIETTDFGMSLLPFSSQIPTVLQMHGSQGQIESNDPRDGQAIETLFLNSLENFGFAQADNIIAYSKKNQKEWQSSLNKEIEYIPPAYKVGNKFEISNEEQFGIVLGRIQYWKGPHVLCEAIRLVKKLPYKIYWLGGDNYYKSYSQSMSSHLAYKYPDIWGKIVIPLGRVPYDEAQNYLSKASFTIVPSLWDTFNFTVLESMGRGKIIGVSEGAGASEHVLNKENGFIFKPYPESLADTINTIINLGSKRRKEIQINAVETVETKFNPDNIIPQRIKSYQLTKDKYDLKKKQPIVLPHGLDDYALNETKLLDKLPIKYILNYMVKRIRNKAFKQK